MPDDDLKDAILSRAPSRTLREMTRSSPSYLSLQADGVLKAISGVTTLEEILIQAHRDPGMRRVGDLSARFT